MQEPDHPGQKPISVVDRWCGGSLLQLALATCCSYCYESESIACRALSEALHRTERISLYWADSEAQQYLSLFPCATLAPRLTFELAT